MASALPDAAAWGTGGGRRAVVVSRKKVMCICVALSGHSGGVGDGVCVDRRGGLGEGRREAGGGCEAEGWL